MPDGAAKLRPERRFFMAARTTVLCDSHPSLSLSTEFPCREKGFLPRRQWMHQAGLAHPHLLGRPSHDAVLFKRLPQVCPLGSPDAWGLLPCGSPQLPEQPRGMVITQGGLSPAVPMQPISAAPGNHAPSGTHEEFQGRFWSVFVAAGGSALFPLRKPISHIAALGNA